MGRVELGWVGLSQVLLNCVELGLIMLGQVGEVSLIQMGEVDVIVELS